MTSTPVMKITTAVLILLSDHVPMTAYDMAFKINEADRFRGVLQRHGAAGVTAVQVYAAMSGLRSKARPTKNLIEPVSGRIGKREPYQLTAAGVEHVRARGLLKRVAAPAKDDGTRPEQGHVERVNHPAHYGGDTTYEVIKVLEAWGLDRNFCLGNVVKYVARAEHKGANVEDLKKAAWYLNREIAKLEGTPHDGQ